MREINKYKLFRLHNIQFKLFFIDECDRVSIEYIFVIVSLIFMLYFSDSEHANPQDL